MILLKKKINIDNCFVVGLAAVYLLKSVLHLKYENIIVINSMQLLHYIDTVAIHTGPVHRRVFAMRYGIKSLLEIYMKFLSLLKFLINKFPWKCKSFQPVFSVERRKIRCDKIENRCLVGSFSTGYLSTGPVHRLIFATHTGFLLNWSGLLKHWLETISF